MENFNLTLFSDVDSDKFTNTSTSFTNSLPFPLDLSEGRLEVGLAEIKFQSDAPPAPPSLTATPVTVKKSVMPIGPQDITVWEQVESIIRCTYPGRHTLSGFIGSINTEIAKEGKLDLKFQEKVISDSKSQFTVTFKRDIKSWIQITQEFAELIGLKSLRIEEGTTTGEPVDDSIYDKLGKPDSTEFKICHFIQTVVKTAATTGVGFDTFLDVWENAISTLKFASIGFSHSYSGDFVILEVLMYTEGEKMKLSPIMNELINQARDYIFDHTVVLTFPKSNFIPTPTPPTPKPIFVDPNKFTYVLCDFIEPQIAGSALIPALAVLPRASTKTLVEKTFDPVYYVTPLRQVVSSVTVRIVNRNLVTLKPDEEISSCTLRFRSI